MRGLWPLRINKFTGPQEVGRMLRRRKYYSSVSLCGGHVPCHNNYNGIIIRTYTYIHTHRCGIKLSRLNRLRLAYLRGCALRQYHKVNIYAMRYNKDDTGPITKQGGGVSLANHYMCYLPVWPGLLLDPAEGGSDCDSWARSVSPNWGQN